MKTKPNNFARASALQITFSIALIFVFAILLATARVATPILGNYPDTTLALSTDTTVTPDAPPTNTSQHQCFHLDRLQGNAGRRSDDGRGAGDGRASGGNLHGDGHSFRQWWRDRD